MIIIDQPYRGVCDFCGGHWRIVATLRCQPFSIIQDDGDVYLDDGQWDTCALCLPLVDRGDIEGLIRRELRINTGLAFAGSIAVNSYRLLSEFLAHRL